MIKNFFAFYYTFILSISLISNFIKMFIHETDYIFGIVLGLTCLALNVYLFAFRYEDGKKIQIMLVAFFTLSIILLVVEVISLEYPTLRNISVAPNPNVYYEPHQNLLMPSNSTLIFIYYFKIISKSFYIVNSAAFAIYYSLKLIKAQK